MDDKTKEAIHRVRGYTHPKREAEINHVINELISVDMHIQELEADNTRLRTILRATVNVTDLLAAGYSVDEANAIAREFGE